MFWALDFQNLALEEVEIGKELLQHQRTGFSYESGWQLID